MTVSVPVSPTLSLSPTPAVTVSMVLTLTMSPISRLPLRFLYPGSQAPPGPGRLEVSETIVVDGEWERPEDGLPEPALRELAEALRLLESPGFLIQVANHVGVPIEKLMARLPGRASRIVSGSVDRALRAALDLAVKSLDAGLLRGRSGRWHTLAATVSGAVGGAGGLAALAVELPVTTTIMLRSIAEIAREEGEDLSRLEARLACLQVFALGGPTTADDAADNAYFAIRAGLADAMRRVAQEGAGRGLTRSLVGFVGKIAARFEIVVSEKAVAQAAPLLGAAGGAAVNAVFIRHFQRMARGHFTVRRLERAWGPEAVRAAARQLAAGRLSA